MIQGIFQNNRPWVPRFDRTNAAVMEGRADEVPYPAMDEFVRLDSRGQRPTYSPDQVRGIMDGPETIAPRTMGQARADIEGSGDQIVSSAAMRGGGYAFGSIPGGGETATGATGAAVPSSRVMEPAAPGAGAGADVDGDGIPDGAEVTRTVVRAGEDGSQTTERAKWTHKAPARVSPREVMGMSVRPEMTPMERVLVAQGMESRDTGRIRTAQNIMGRYDQAADRVANMENTTRKYYDPAAAQAMGAMGAAEATAGAAADEKALDWFWKGRQDARATGAETRGQEYLDLNRQSTEAGLEDREEKRTRQAKLEQRVEEDIARGRQSGKPFDVAEQNGVKMVHAWGDMDPRTGEPIWRTVTQDFWSSVGGAQGGAGGTAAGAAAGTGPAGGGAERYPTLTPEQVQTIPPGTYYRGTDGKLRVR